jgi:hypothetical protein
MSTFISDILNYLNFITIKTSRLRFALNISFPPISHQEYYFYNSRSNLYMSVSKTLYLRWYKKEL